MTTGTIQTRGAELLLDDVGHGEPALIFLHYWGGSARTWSRVLAQLPASVRAVALNQRGWGGSRATDGRHDLDALADDVADVVQALGIGRYVLVGHSMGGKVAQVLAGRQACGLAGLVLVAPAPPTPMEVPPEVRVGMLASYQSREGLLEALKVLAGPTLDMAGREQVLADTLSGDAEAKRFWPQTGMTTDVSSRLPGVDLSVEILVGDRDQVERESLLRPIFSRYFPQARFTTIANAGHLLPLEVPEAVAGACKRAVEVVPR